jgi:hypothetical protein
MVSGKLDESMRRPKRVKEKLRGGAILQARLVTNGGIYK